MGRDVHAHTVVSLWKTVVYSNPERTATGCPATGCLQRLLPDTFRSGKRHLRPARFGCQACTASCLHFASLWPVGCPQCHSARDVTP
jgi:hypothetical protein